MPFKSPSQYLDCLDLFLPHWSAGNTALGAPANAIVLRGGYTVASLTTDRAALAASLTSIQNLFNARQTAAADRDIRRAALRERQRQFRAAISGFLPGTFYLKALPKLPPLNAPVANYLTAFDDMASLWNRINTDAPPPSGFTPPLTLAGGYTLAAFQTDLAAFRTVATAVQTATQNLRIAIQQREDLADAIRPRLKEYRQAVAARFPAGHALIQSLPDLSPPSAPGLTGVASTALWDATADKARIEWQPTTYATAAYYEVRYHPGPAYKADEEQFVARVPLGTTLFLTDVGLPAPGSVGFFKVYVVTQRGAEKAGRTVKIVRP